jgi:hypothetical protein
MPLDHLAATVVALMRRSWDLQDVSDISLLPHAHRMIRSVRAGMSHDALVSELSDTFFVQLIKATGNRAQLDALAGQIRTLVTNAT